MERSIPEVLAILAIAALGLLLIGFLGFAFMFGAADNTQVAFEAQQLSADEVVDDSTYDPTEHQQSFVEHTLRNGTSRHVRLHYDPFFDEAPAHQIHERGGAEFVYVEQEGTFYRVAVANVSEAETQRQTLELVRVNETSGDVIQYDELPTVDQREVRSAHVLKHKRDCGDTSRTKGTADCWSTYSTSDANRSILVPSPPADYVRYENQTYELVASERTVEGTAITYQATPVSNDSAAFRSQFVTEVNEGELTEGERELLEQAIGEGYHIQVHRHDFKEVPRERFNSLLPKLGLPSLDSLSGAHHGSSVGYIDYRGAYYRVHIEYADTYA